MMDKNIISLPILRERRHLEGLFQSEILQHLYGYNGQLSAFKSEERSTEELHEYNCWYRSRGK